MPRSSRYVFNSLIFSTSVKRAGFITLFKAVGTGWNTKTIEIVFQWATFKSEKATSAFLQRRL
jgi:hypothetical protein